MSFWRKLFGGRTTTPPVEDAWESIKRVARENERRQREALEGTPRASPAEIAAQASNLRSIDQLDTLYSKMRHADFCDVVAMAVRMGNFSEQDASHALYVMEWVRSGGARRISFPEWLDREGREHFALLDREWLRSATDRRMSFNEWLVGLSTQATAKDTRGATAAPVAVSKWHVQGNKLIRTYKFSGLPPPEATVSLEIECSVGRYLSGFINTNLWFHLQPYLYLRPSRQPFENHLVTAPFSVGLIADGSGAGTEASPLVQGGVFKVHACSTEEEPDTASLGVINIDDVMECVKTIASGQPMTFTILDYDAEPAVKLRLRLPNDREFQQLYDKLRAAV